MMLKRKLGGVPSFDLSSLGGSSSTSLIFNHLDLVVGTDIGGDFCGFARAASYPKL